MRVVFLVIGNGDSHLFSSRVLSSEDLDLLRLGDLVLAWVESDLSGSPSGESSLPWLSSEESVGYELTGS